MRQPLSPPAWRAADPGGSAQISAVVMPLQNRSVGPFGRIVRQSELPPMKSAIFLPVIENVFDLVADNKSIVGVDRCVSSVKNTMDSLRSNMPLDLVCVPPSA